jgi:hypothetical protein
MRRIRVLSLCAAGVIVAALAADGRSQQPEPAPARPVIAEGVALDAKAREAVLSLSAGMSADSVLNVLQPVCRTWAFSFGGAVIFHLPPDAELVIRFNQNDGKVKDFAPVRAKGKWRGWFWKTTAEDAKPARELAAAKLRADGAAGVDLAESYPPNPGGRLGGGDVPVELELFPGRREVLLMSAVEGRWQTHRTIAVNVMRGKQWLYQVIVDVDDRAVVPSRWKPTDAEVKHARAIADATLAGFLAKAAAAGEEVRVQADGVYDYGPVRKLVTLTYRRGRELIYRTVDPAAGKLFED